MIEYLRKKITHRRTKIIRKIRINDKKFISKKKFHLKNFGNLNPNKKFYLIRRFPGGGLFSNLNYIANHLLIANKLNYIPIVDMENYPNIYNCNFKVNKTFNSWLYYFRPLSKFSLNDIYKSKNVYLSTLNSNQLKNYKNFSDYTSAEKKIIFKYIKFNKKILDKANNFNKKKIRKKRILGIHFRGSDQKTQERHPLPASEKQMLSITKSLLKKYKFDLIFLSTEEKNYLNIFLKKFPRKIVYFSNPRTDKKDLFDNNSKYHRYKIGEGNILDMLILSKTKHLLFVQSNLAEAAIFFSKNKIFSFKIKNGYNSKNIFFAQIYWFIKKNLPRYLGGFNLNPFK